MYHTLNAISRSAFLKQSALLATGLAISISAMALPTDRNQPVSLQAEHATFNEKTGVTTYTGNVSIEQGTMKLQADSIVAQLNAKREIQTITAVGRPAKFQQQISADKGLAKGEAQKIIYNAESGIITLSGSAFLSQGGASIRGNSLRYSMNKGDIEAQGSSSNRVQLTIPPSSSKSFPGARE